MIQIIPMTIDHVAQVAQVDLQCLPNPWSKDAFEKEMKENERAIYFVAEHQEHIVGYGGMWHIIDEGHITNIAVLPQVQKQGIGSMLLQALVNKAESLALMGMTLEVRKSNKVAQALYRKFQFESVGTRKNYYQNPSEEAVIMWKYF